jgi:hypothetical protein
MDMVARLAAGHYLGHLSNSKNGLQRFMTQNTITKKSQLSRIRDHGFLLVATVVTINGERLLRG